MRLIWVQFSVWFSFTITHIHILNNHLYLIYNSITSIPFNSSSFQNHSIHLSFSSILPFLPSFQHNLMNSVSMHPISYSFRICTLLDSQYIMYVTSLLHYYSIYQKSKTCFVSLLFHNLFFLIQNYSLCIFVSIYITIINAIVLFLIKIRTQNEQIMISFN